jgi:xylose dehydrogenase (NAD/NADP)
MAKGLQYDHLEERQSAMSTDTLNWGLLSTARINRALIPVLKRSKRNRLTTVASRDSAAAEAYAREWGIPRISASYEALLADPEVQVIYNPLPNSLHAEWTIRALYAGKHVLCEKPLAVTVEEVDAMTAAARETGRVLAEAFMYRHHEQTLRVKEIVDSGRLGSIRSMRGAFTFNLRREVDVRLAKGLGGGSIWDVGCYPISYARMLMDAEPVEVFGWQVTGESGVDVTFAGQMKFPNDVLAQFDSGFRSALRQHFEVVGSEAMLRIPMPFKPGTKEEIILRNDEETQRIKVIGEELYLGEIEDMADAILLGKQPRISLQDSRGNVAAILALIESARSGRPVRL